MVINLDQSVCNIVQYIFCKLSFIQNKEIIFLQTLNLQYGIRAISLIFFLLLRITLVFFFSFLLKYFLKHSSMAASSCQTESSAFSEMDYSNPFFLHHGDSPGAILVSQQLTLIITAPGKEQC